MAKTRLGKVSRFLDHYDENRFCRKKDVDRLVTDVNVGIALLEDSLQNWNDLLAQYEKLSGELELSDLIETRPTASEILAITQRLLDTFVKTRRSILSPDLESLQDEIASDVGKLLDHLVDLLKFWVPGKSPSTPPEMFLETFMPLSISSSKRAISTRKTGLANLRRKLTQHKMTSSSARRWGPGACWWLLLPILTVISFYLSDGWWPSDVKDMIKLAIKLIVWVTLLLWFPTNFVPAFQESRIMKWSFYILVWVFGLLFWVYGILMGLAVATILAIPIIRLMNSDNRNLERKPLEALDKSIYKWGWLSMLLVGIITRENAWFLGGVIWWTFILIAKISFRNFRFTFDMITAVNDSQDVALLRRRMIYFALVATILILSPGLLGRLQQSFVIEAYKEVATIAFGLIAILIGVQAIVPSITSWGGSASKEGRTASEVREMKLYLLHNRGLMGFMQIFFIVFIISLIGTGSTSLLPTSSIAVDLSISFLFRPVPNMLDVLNPWGPVQISSETTRIFLHTMLFAVFTTLFFHSLAVLYYLFIATNALTIPIKDALISKPVLIEKTTINDKVLEEKDLVARLQRNLADTRDLRGDVISELTLMLDDDKQPSCRITISEGFANTSQLIHQAMYGFSAIFSVPDICSGQVVISRAGSDAPLDRLFSLELTRKEFDFIKKNIEGMDTEYKMVQMGAIIMRYQLPEAQIL